MHGLYVHLVHTGTTNKPPDRKVLTKLACSLGFVETPSLTRIKGN
jgi:hypothetical protein